MEKMILEGRTIVEEVDGVRRSHYEGKYYILCRKESKRTTRMSDVFGRDFANVDYFTYERNVKYHKERNSSGEGTPFTFYSSVPQIAGADYFVEHSGDSICETIYVAHGDKVFLSPKWGLTIDPETGECEYDEYGNGLDIEVRDDTRFGF